MIEGRMKLLVACYIALVNIGTFAASALPSYCGKTDASEEIPSIITSEIIGEYGNLTLLQAQILVRHGARTPLDANCYSGYNTTWNCDNAHDFTYTGLSKENTKPQRRPRRVFEKIFQDGFNQLRGSCDLGQLLDQGFEQHQLNGRIFRKAYIGAGSHKLFPSVDAADFANEADIYLESSNTQRTIMSGQTAIESMFSSTTGDFAIARWHTGDIKRHYYYPNPDRCPRLAKMEKEMKNSEYYRSWRHSAKQKELDMYLNKTFKSWDQYGVYDCYMANLCTGYENPAALTPGTVKEIIAREDRETAFLFNTTDNAYSKLGMTPLVKRIRSRMLARKANLCGEGNLGPKFVFYSGHDWTLMALLASFGSNAWNGEYVPYASYMAIELYKTTKSSHIVRVIMNGKSVQLPGCRPNGICDLETFSAITAFATKEENCNV